MDGIEMMPKMDELMYLELGFRTAMLMAFEDEGS